MAITAADIKTGSCRRCAQPLRLGRKFCSPACYHATKRPEAPEGQRRCRDCHELYPDLNSNLRTNWCADCRRTYHRRRNEGSAQKQRERNLRKYNLSADAYDAQLARQAGVCAICAAEPNGRRLAVDHCHETGALRGLLCFNCNSALGKFRDDAALLAKAIAYLEGSWR